MTELGQPWMSMSWVPSGSEECTCKKCKFCPVNRRPGLTSFWRPILTWGEGCVGDQILGLGPGFSLTA
jgi:hypothetical protein